MEADDRAAPAVDYSPPLSVQDIEDDIVDDKKNVKDEAAGEDKEDNEETEPEQD